MAATGKNLPAFIMSILTPAISGVDNIWMFMGIYLFSNILWLFGINGSSIVFPIVFALCIANTGVNAELVNAGKAPTALINLQMFRYVLLGGAGNTLGLVLLMCKSKSKHIRSIGRLSVLPSICGINEPIIFWNTNRSKSNFINSVSNHAMSFGRSWLSCSKYGTCFIRLYCRSIVYTILCTRVLIGVRY